MKKVLLLIFFGFFGFNNINAQFDGLLNKAKNKIMGTDDDENGLAIKEALNFGVKEAVAYLSAENGYLESPYKILLPEEAKKVLNKVKIVPGFQDAEEKLIQKMNQAAEYAADKATPIFVSAIKEMTVEDGLSIIMGEQNAGTQYLEKSTRKELYKAFMPVIQESLDEVNARTYWKSVVTAYNKIPFTKDVNPQLDDHVNNKALDGMFSLIAVKEAGIRGDTSQRTTELLRKVFAKQDN